jgi:hypothetical protein
MPNLGAQVFESGKIISKKLLKTNIYGWKRRRNFGGRRIAIVTFQWCQSMNSSDVVQATKQRNLLFVALFSFIALASSSQYFSDKQLADDSLRWPGTLARVEWTGIDVLKTSRFVPTITYTYRVADKVFKSTDVSYPCQQFSSRSDCETFISKFPVGRQVAAFYDPKNPSRACLVAGETDSLKNRVWLIFVQFGAAVLAYFLPAGFFPRRRVMGSDALQMIQPSRKSRRY